MSESGIGSQPQVVTETMNNGPAIEAEQLMNLCVCDLDVTVTEEILLKLFGDKGDVTSVSITTDELTFSRKGYLQYSNSQDAAKAMDELHCISLNGKTMRISYSGQEGRVLKNPTANIFVKNLHVSINQRAFYDMFYTYGKIISSKLETNPVSGESRGFGFVQYLTEEDARKAIDGLNGKTVCEKKLYVGIFESKEEREKKILEECKRTLCLKNLDAGIDEEMLKELFAPFGTVTSSKVVRDGRGVSKGLGSIVFSTAEEALRGLMQMKETLDVEILQHTRAEPTVSHMHPSMSRNMNGVIQPSVMFAPRGPRLVQNIGQAPHMLPYTPGNLQPNMAHPTLHYAPRGPLHNQNMSNGKAPYHMPTFGYPSQLSHAGTRPGFIPQYHLFGPGPQGMDFASLSGRCTNADMVFPMPNHTQRRGQNANNFLQGFGMSNGENPMHDNGMHHRSTPVEHLASELANASLSENGKGKS